MSINFDRFDYAEAKQILEIIVKNPLANLQDNYGALAWFGVAKFFREYMFLNRNSSICVEFAKRAIKAFLKADLPYAAIRVLEDLSKMELDIGTLEQIIDDTKLSPLEEAKVIIYEHASASNPQYLHKYLLTLRNIFATRKLEASLRLRRLIRKLGKLIDLDTWKKIFDDIRHFDETLYCKLFGIYLVHAGRLYLMTNLVKDYSNKCLLYALYEAANEAKSEDDLEIIRNILENLNLREFSLNSGNLDILARVLSVLLSKNQIISFAFVEEIIQRLYRERMFDSAIMLSLRYSLQLLKFDPKKSLAYLDLAVMLAYELKEKSTAIDIFSDYIAHAYELNLKGWLRQVVDIIYNENKIIGVQNFFLFEKLLDKIKREDPEIISLLNNLKSKFSYAKDFIEPLIYLIKIKFNPTKKLLLALLNSHPIYIMKATRIIPLDGKYIRMFLSFISKSELTPADRASIYYTLALRSRNKPELLKLILDIIYRDNELKASPKYPLLLLDLAQQLKGLYNSYAYELASRAFIEFERRHMFWMAINALALKLALEMKKDTFAHQI